MRSPGRRPATPSRSTWTSWWAEGLLEAVYQRRTGRTGPGQAAQASGEPPRAALDRRARELGGELGRKARSAAPAPCPRDAVMLALESLGYEPRAVGDTVDLVNCPFHSLARQHTELVCGMNLCLVTGLLEGLAATDVTARLEPDPEHCCVRLHPAGHPSS
ncbi:hypothetical protein [Nonomuraea sp. NPDC050202]|jgi:predicted ArsR family transcriptional regulator|uniref:hypothetical protein n=1 Tax=Nonomuraea sp. NPDC050202 TaxID=3155035 RepID=UPI0033C1BCA3